MNNLKRSVTKLRGAVAKYEETKKLNEKSLDLETKNCLMMEALFYISKAEALEAKINKRLKLLKRGDFFCQQFVKKFAQY